MVESAGWERALWFEANAGLAPPPHEQRRDAWASRYWSPAIGREHHATRTAAGIFDLTPFTKVEVEGAGAVDWLNRVCASEMDRPVGRIVYTTVLTPDGGVVCDLTVTRLAEDRYLVVTGGGSGPRDVAWLRRRLPDGGGVRLRDVTSGTAVVGLWGPRARDVLARLVRDDLGSEAFPYLAARQIWVEHVPALALRISYAGELGWELYVPTEYGRWLWDRLAEAGEPDGAVAVGLGAFESLRIEKGYRFAGVDMHTDYSADEAGLGFTVHLTKPSFTGREAVLRERERGVAQAARAGRARRPRRRAAGRRAAARRRRGGRLRDERELRLQRRREHRLRLPARGGGRRGAARRRAHLRSHRRGDGRDGAALRPGGRAATRLSRARPR